MSAPLLVVLHHARALVERGWTQGSEARNADGDKVPAASREACQWCALGAVLAVIDQRGGSFTPAFDALSAQIPDPAHCGAVWLYNDDQGRTKDEILALYDRAILAAQGAR